MREEFSRLLQEAKAFFDNKDQVREQALVLCREITRDSAFSIRALHKGEIEDAERLLSEAEKKHKSLLLLLEGHPDLRHTGFVYDAEKEFVEAHIILSVKKKEAFPSFEHLGVLYTAYLNGIGEAMGEVRRMLLDCIRQGELAICEELLNLMEEVYYFLSSLLYPDAITGNLRRTVDMIRGVLERSRGDLTLAMMMLPLQKEKDSEV